MTSKLLRMTILLCAIITMAGCVTKNVTSVDQSEGIPIANGKPLKGVTVFLFNSYPAVYQNVVNNELGLVLAEYGATLVNSKSDANLLVELKERKETTGFLPALTLMPFLISVGTIPGVGEGDHQIEISVTQNGVYGQKNLLKQVTSVKSLEFLGWTSRLFCGGNYPKYCSFEKPHAIAALIKTMNEMSFMKQNGEF